MEVSALAAPAPAHPCTRAPRIPHQRWQQPRRGDDDVVYGGGAHVRPIAHGADRLYGHTERGPAVEGWYVFTIGDCCVASRCGLQEPLRRGEKGGLREDIPSAPVRHPASLSPCAPQCPPLSTQQDTYPVQHHQLATKLGRSDAVLHQPDVLQVHEPGVRRTVLRLGIRGLSLRLRLFFICSPLYPQRFHDNNAVADVGICFITRVAAENVAIVSSPLNSTRIGLLCTIHETHCIYTVRTCLTGLSARHARAQRPDPPGVHPCLWRLLKRQLFR